MELKDSVKIVKNIARAIVAVIEIFEQKKCDMDAIGGVKVNGKMLAIVCWEGKNNVS